MKYIGHMQQRADVLIVGGGVIGLTTAYFLATRTGAQVAVLDRGGLGQEASWAGAGIIPPGKPETATSPDAWLQAVSGSMIADLSRELHEAVGIDNGYRVSGGIELPADEPIDTAAWTRGGIEWDEVPRHGSHADRAGPCPNRGSAFFLPGMAQIRNPRHLQALIAASGNAGVELRPGCSVLGFERNEDRITGVQTSEGRRCHDQYLVCAGAVDGRFAGPSRLPQSHAAGARTDCPAPFSKTDFAKSYFGRKAISRPPGRRTGIGRLDRGRCRL